MNVHTQGIGQDGIEDVLKPIDVARGLPNEFYISQERFEEEKQSVFFSNWSAIGFAKDIPEHGDAMPIEFLGVPLVAVRDKHGSVNVFQNACRHRGMPLVQEKGRLRGTLRCPYHSWCYGLDGRLVTTPHVGGPGQNTHPGIRREELGLLKVRSHIWRDIIFVNISGDAPEFKEYAADVIERWKEFEQPLVHGGEGSSFKLEVKTNWKLAIENYCESYHLPWVHPGLNSYSRLEDHYNIEEDGKFSGQGTMVYRQINGEAGESFPNFEGLSQKWDEGAEYLAFYPNVLLGVHRDHAFAIILEPKAVDETVEHVEIYYTDEGANAPELDALRSANAMLWKGVFIEDIFVVEGMQKGRHAPMFDGGKFSPVMDGPTHTFHRWVAGEFKKARQAGAR